MDRFRIIEQIGDTVHKALDLESNEYVAVKRVEKSKLPSISLNCLYKEALIHKRLEHPSIVKLVDSIDTDDCFYMIMEYVSGGDLFDYLKRCRIFKESEAKLVAKQLFDATEYMHRMGIVHRDLKFENILIQTCASSSKVDVVVKISDFGLSKCIFNTSTKTPCGTLGYSAPEVMKAQNYEKSVDCWSLGCIIYAMLCGFIPFIGMNDDELFRNINRGWYTFPSPWFDSISNEAKDLISKLLQVDPKKRISAKDALEHPWIQDLQLDPSQFSDVWEIPSDLSTPSSFSSETPASSLLVAPLESFEFNSDFQESTIISSRKLRVCSSQ